MASKYAQHFSAKMTPPMEPVPGKDQAANSAGGYVFRVGDFERLRRFLVLGCEGGTYYASEKKLTKENAECVLRCLAADPAKTVEAIVEISNAGRAPKNDPAVFALALVVGFGDFSARAMAYDAMPKVLRIPTHLFQFVEAVKEFRGWGAGLRKAIGKWYNIKDDNELAYHMCKYQQRNGMSHRDVLRLSHAVATTPAKASLFRWAVVGPGDLGTRNVVRRRPDNLALGIEYEPVGDLPRIVRAFEEAKTADENTLIRLIREDGLPRECVPTQHLNSAAVWEAMLAKSMPLTAMIRSLGKMTAVGLIKPLSDAGRTIAGKLGDQDYIRKSRVHPINILMALKTYASGRGDKGSLSWSPSQQVVDALDAAFYTAFGNVEPANKRTVVGVDVSGSMYSGNCVGCNLRPAEAAAAIAMITLKTEPACVLVGYSHNLVPLDFGNRTRLDDVVRYMSTIRMGGTDCSLPMQHAINEKFSVDTFISLTDNETWAGGPGHVFQWLQRYRNAMGIQARSIVAAFTATEFTIADPGDPLSLDVCGLDSAAPGLMTDFSAGRI